MQCITTGSLSGSSERYTVEQKLCGSHHHHTISHHHGFIEGVFKQVHTRSLTLYITSSHHITSSSGGSLSGSMERYTTESASLSARSRAENTANGTFTRTHTHMHMDTHTRTQAYGHTHTHTHTHTHPHTHTYTLTHSLTHTLCLVTPDLSC